MLQKCPNNQLHRITCILDADHATNPLVELPLRTPCPNALRLRSALHQALGSRLRGYRLALDMSGRQATVILQMHASDMQESLQLLMATFPAAEFGRVARVMTAEVRRCH
ncbi:hypothetical protein [Acidovorax sp. CCYZU-2555]|uniref:hypothetical protein n=1 Tax=Acidovorax sp. CCYZU-2555 TaxID=2835042 RepID=UPI001BD0DA1F|nr:hypothetical protein [Acidovorax sp. CCYZU-2555]MBS7776494.1 hypothetical protein [Acidovorax sp. CCYZU-2555]